MSQTGALRETPLHSEHQALKARMVPFAGWNMPVQYAGVLAEHKAVRTAAGLFDVSHMGQVLVSGSEAESFLHHLTPNHVRKLETGQAHYTALLTPQGTFVDDMLIYRLESGRFLLVVNAANAAKDLSWICSHADGDVQVADVSDQYALLALQGPKSTAVLSRLLGRDLSGIRPFRFVMVQQDDALMLVSRTGYTGEDGFEIYLPPDAAPALWRGILKEGEDVGVIPAGLGARDTLRLEAALPLYGQDIDDQRTPWDAGLNFIVKMDAGDFIGREALQRQKDEGVQRRLTGFAIAGRGIARHGHEVLQGGKRQGTVTSGTHSPTLGRAIGMTYLPVDQRREGTALTVNIRGNEVEAATVPLPFYRRPRA